MIIIIFKEFIIKAFMITIIIFIIMVFMIIIIIIKAFILIKKFSAICLVLSKTFYYLIQGFNFFLLFLYPLLF